MRIGQPQLPNAQAGDAFDLALVRALHDTLRSIINQLNALSDGTGSANTTARTSPPTGGTYAAGDFIRNSAPTAGGVFGWVCVAKGTPGVWKAVLIQA